MFHLHASKGSNDCDWMCWQPQSVLCLLNPPHLPSSIKRRVVKQFYVMSLQKFQKPAAPSVQAEVTASDGETDESKRLLTGKSRVDQ